MRNNVAEALITAGRWYVRHAPGAPGKGPLAAALNPRLRDRPRRAVVRARCGSRMAVDTQDLIQRYIYMFGAWEPHMTRWLQRRLQPGDTFVDVGANIGYFSLLASQLVGPSGHVVAIEASPLFHRKLVAHVELNAGSNVRTVNAAVSAEREKLLFTLASSTNMGANSAVPYAGTAESTFEAEAQPLPDLLTPTEIAGARIIKIDVEGAEGRVVRGMAPLLAKLRSDAEITVEVTPERMEQLGDSADELLSTMRDHGFHMYRLANDYAPESYPAALARVGRGPVRWRGPMVGECDLVFSRTDAEMLA
ncbi:FkbM family methyltransferase [Streptomyces sp. NPDC001262]|uniref:FkbM family methyltransferase n=1 Tax=Streptomyces sp. NPDC001262 TaxID=3364552 RepID=UPI0036B2BD2E